MAKRQRRAYLYSAKALRRIREREASERERVILPNGSLALMLANGEAPLPRGATLRKTKTVHR